MGRHKEEAYKPYWQREQEQREEEVNRRVGSWVKWLEGGKRDGSRK